MKVLEILSKMYEKYIQKDENFEDIFYIGGNDNLPAPLEPEEEAEEKEKLSNGDKEAKKKLVEHNLRLVVYIAKKFENTGVGLEDLISIGTIGLMKAINTFNNFKISPDNFSTLLSSFIFSSIFYFLFFIGCCANCFICN